jgi:hypothetical protein
MDPILAIITLATFVEDLVELGRKIKHSIDQVCIKVKFSGFMYTW